MSVTRIDEPSHTRSAMLSVMLDAVRMEIRRLATVRSSYLIVTVMLLLGGAVALMIGLLAPDNTALSPARTAAALTVGADSVPMSATGGLLALLGVLMVGHDYRFGLLRVVLIAQPRRDVVVTARLVVLAGIAVVVALGVSVIGAGVCWLVGRTPTLDGTTLRVAATHVALAVLWAWLGAGLTWVLRNSAGAVSVLLVGPLLVEPVLALAVQADGSGILRGVFRWLPFTAARQALGQQLYGSSEMIGALAGGVVFTGATILVLGCGWLLLQRRDV